MRALIATVLAMALAIALAVALAMALVVLLAVARPMALAVALARALVPLRPALAAIPQQGIAVIVAVFWGLFWRCRSALSGAGGNVRIVCGGAHVRGKVLPFL